jgi:hypothetical protein
MGQNQYGPAGQRRNNCSSYDSPIHGKYGKVAPLVMRFSTPVKNGMGHGMDIPIGAFPAKSSVTRTGHLQSQKVSHGLFSQTMQCIDFHKSLTLATKNPRGIKMQGKNSDAARRYFKILYTRKLLFLHTRL